MFRLPPQQEPPVWPPLGSQPCPGLRGPPPGLLLRGLPLPPWLLALQEGGEGPGPGRGRAGAERTLFSPGGPAGREGRDGTGRGRGAAGSRPRGYALG